MTGKVVHFEVPFDDGDRARAFYRDVFGWQLQVIPEMQYTMVSTGPMTQDGMPAEPGFIGGGMLDRQGDVDRPVITIEVDNMDDALTSIAAHGGQAVGEPMKVGDMGIACYFKDSEGNLMGLWQNA
jgi:predicted enzyme related to lactoylglutathione lyase